MAYQKENYLPVISEKAVLIPYNNEIKGFIAIQEKVENDFFSTISKNKFNKSLQDINFKLQRLFCEKLTLQNETNFLALNLALKIAILVVTAILLITFIMLEANTDALKDFRSTTAIVPVIIVIIIIAIFSVAMISILAHEKQSIIFEKAMIKVIKNHIKSEEHWYKAQGYHWVYDKETQRLTIEKDF